MSAVFEISLFLTRIEKAYSLLNECFGANLVLDDLLVVDNWEFKNQCKLDIGNLLSQVNKGKIAFAYGTLGNKHKCGFILYQIDNRVNSVNVWISSKHMPFLDNPINQDNEHIYNLITKYVAENLGEDLLLCGIGPEISIQYKEKIADTIQSGHGVYEWIVPKSHNIHIAGYKMTEHNECVVWRQTH